MQPFSVYTAFLFSTSILEEPLLAHLWPINQKLVLGSSGGLQCCSHLGVGTCYGSPPTALRSTQNTLIFVFHLNLRWRSNERALSHRWAHRPCVCAHTLEKPAIPFAYIDMGLPVQSCYKDYCLLRSHFISLQHTPQGAQ